MFAFAVLCIQLFFKCFLYVLCRKESKVRFAVSSVLAPQGNQKGHTAAVRNLPSDWLVYEEMTRVHRMANVHCCTAISPITVAIFAGPAKLALEAVSEAESGTHGMFLEH